MPVLGTAQQVDDPVSVLPSSFFAATYPDDAGR
jgi:hypothetical protein